MKGYIIGYILLTLTLIWAVAETKYFGWSIIPTTKEELMCDAASMMGLFVSMFFIKKGRRGN